ERTGEGSEGRRMRGLKAAVCLAGVVVLAGAAGASAAPLAYITDESANALSIVDTSTNTVVATVPVGTVPIGVAVTPDGSGVYVANSGDGTVSVIDTSTNTVVATVPVGVVPIGVAVTPDGSGVYVAN